MTRPMFRSDFDLIRRRLRRPSTFVTLVGSTLATQILLLVLGTITAAIIARTLGPEGKGILQLALMLPAMLSLFLNGGIGVANVHYAGSGRYTVAQLTWNSLLFAFWGTVGGAGIVAAMIAGGHLATVIPGVSTGFFLLSMLVLPMSLLSGYLQTILQGIQAIHAVNRIRLLFGSVNLLLLILFVLILPWGIPGAILATLAATLFSLVLLVRSIVQAGGSFRFKRDREVFGTTLRFGLRGYVGNVLQFFNYRLDVLILNFLLGPASVGIYSVATKLAELVWYFPNAMGFVLFPKAAGSSSQEMNSFTPRVFRITLLISVAAAAAIALVGYPFIILVYTQEFASAFVPLLVLLPGVVLLGSARVLTSDISGRGFPHYNSINAGIVLVVTVVLDLILIPRRGLVGAAAASTIAYSITFLAAVVFYSTVSRNPAVEPTDTLL